MKEKTYAEAQEQALMIDQANDRKLDQFAAYQQARVQARKKNLPAPIIKDKEGNLRWLNRAQRRKQKIK